MQQNGEEITVVANAPVSGMIGFASAIRREDEFNYMLGTILKDLPDSVRGAFSPLFSLNFSMPKSSISFFVLKPKCFSASSSTGKP